MTTHLTHKTVDSLINQALAIEDESAQEAGSLGFMARVMVQATLPHRKVDGTYFERRNGAFTLSMLASPKIGLPYGSIPRLLLAWVTTEAVRTKERELDLGHSMSAFMADLGMSRQGSNITSLKNQTRKLFNATISANYQEGHNTQDIGYRIADKTVLWWHAKNPEQAGLWTSTVTLSEIFFNEIIDRPVPIDMRAIKTLKQSPLALDIYATLTYRMSYLKKPTLIPWSALAFQLGSDYSRLRAFKEAFLIELKKVVMVYPQVHVEPTDRGLMLWPSLTHISKKAG